MTRYVKKEEGVALMLVLVMSAVILAVMTAMIYMITSATKTSGSGKRYASCMEASLGSESVVRAFMAARGDISNIDDGFVSLTSLAASPGLTDECLDKKINNTTTYWPSGCDSSPDIDIDDNSTYDVKFSLGDYDIYAKISNTIEGNSSAAGGGGEAMKNQLTGVAYQFGGSGGGMIGLPPIPYNYRIELETASRKNSGEKCSVAMLYEY